MCRPSATSAKEPNRLPPTISRSIIALHNPMTAQVLRSLLSWPAPRKMWSCPAPNAASLKSLILALLEIAMDDFDKLLGRAASRLFVGVGIDEVGTDVVLEHDGQQTIHRP